MIESSAAFGQRPDLTALAGNYLGDEAGDTADLIANHVRQSHHTTSIGKTSGPSRYAEHARATHVASHSARESMQDDDGLSERRYTVKFLKKRGCTHESRHLSDSDNFHAKSTI